MSVSILEPTARLRKSRTRTKKVSFREALTISALRPHQYDLRPACASLICPDCQTWVPITGIQAKVHKLVPHHAGTALQDAPIRCSGSNRRVIVDVRFEVWERRLQEGGAETNGRRSNRVTRKPKVTPAPTVSQIAAQKQTTTGDKPSDGRPLWLVRKKQWASAESAVRDVDTRRAQLPAGDAPLAAPPVPLRTLRPERRTSA